MKRYSEIKEKHLAVNKLDRILKSEWKYGVLGQQERSPLKNEDCYQDAGQGKTNGGSGLRKSVDSI